MFDEKNVLITGGTGSFGKAVLSRLLQTNVAEIRIFSRDEKKQEDMRNATADGRVKFIIGDVRDKQSLLSAMKDVNLVFHAAALKQVPSCEFYPMQAVYTNISGTENVIEAAVSKGVEKVVVLSTDKAVYPINAMGLTKALAEKIVVSKSRGLSSSETIVCATRYGNVLGSRGSVVPLFIDQIRKGEALTVTDPSMTRFLMTLDESVELVFHAFKNASQGDIFVQKASAATIGDLAKATMALFDLESEIKIIGTRHGEKLYETLVSREEMTRVQEENSFYRIPADVRDLNYKKYFYEGEVQISESKDFTSHNTTRLNKNQILEILLKLNLVNHEQ